MSCKFAPECSQAVADVRDDASDTDFAVLNYTSKTSIGLAASGVGGLDAAKAHFPENDVAYALIRKKFNWETVGSVKADTIKFVFVYWRPEQIPVARKMKIGIFEGQVKRLLEPYHSNLDCATQDEINEDVLAALLGKITMRASNVTAKKATGMYVAGKTVNSTASPAAAARAAAPNKAATADAPLALEDAAEFDGAMARLRSDAGADAEVDWLVAGYTPALALSLVACGGGGVTGLRGALAAAGAELPDVRHGLVRVTERIDNSDTVKFCFVTVAPSAGVAPGRQGRIGTVRGRAVARFRPYHGDVTVNVAEELTEDGVMGAVSNLRAGNKGTTWS